MSKLQEALARIVARAAFLQERVQEDKFVPQPTPATAIQNRLNYWQKESARGNPERFQRRLEWQGWTQETATLPLQTVALREYQPLPNWALLLQTIVEHAQSEAKSRPLNPVVLSHRAYDPKESLPYQEFFRPWLEVAALRLQEMTGADYALLSDHAHAMLERALLRQWSDGAAASLELEFAVRRAAARGGLARLLNTTAETPTRNAYEEFITSLLEPEAMLRFFQEYAALARFLTTRLLLWLEVSVEFVARLQTDASAIATAFNIDHATLFPIQNLQTTLSDSHDHGRSVIVVTSANGQKFVYKPKDIGLEAAWYEVLTWLNARQPLHPFKIFSAVVRDGYGWVDFVDHHPCKTTEEVQEYYQRSGMMLALFFVLEATDNHLENIIAHGDQPVLIDMEALMHQRNTHDARQTGERSAPNEAFAQISNSVLRTGFLPIWMIHNDKSYDGSGLASQGDQRTGIKVAAWRDINTDQMRLVSDTYIMKAESNFPSLNGESVPLEAYIDDIVIGFRHLYQQLLDHRNELLESDGPLATMFRQKARFIFRNTTVYVTTLKRGYHPRYMREGTERSLLFEGLSAAMTRETTKPLAWRLWESEREALEIGDVPIFFANADNTALASASEVLIEDYFMAPAQTWVTQRIVALTPEDLEFQVALIRGSLYARVTATTPAAHEGTGITEANGEVPSRTATDFIAEAERIAADLKARAVRGQDGSLTWVALGYILYAEKYQLQPLGVDLYNGLGGIALFFAALAKVTENEGYRQDALKILHPIRQQIKDAKRLQRLTHQIGIGAAVGIGSLMYTFATVSTLINEPSLLEEAHLLTASFTSEQLQQDHDLDLARGASGALLAVVKLYEQTHNSALLDLGDTIAAYLVQQQHETLSGYKAWANPDKMFLSGILHGAGGIAYALLRFYHHRREPLYQAVAQQGIDFEQSLFVAERNNWLPHENAPMQTIMSTWCHGAPGIGMSRIGSMLHSDHASFADTIQHALTGTRESGLKVVDHLCCGNFGRLDLFITAHQHGLYNEGLETARLWGSRLMHRKQTTGSYQFSPDIPADLYQPGLFSGTAGVGYGLLRLAEANAIPSILLWE